MTIRTVTYDDATHVILPIDPCKSFFDAANKADDKSWIGSCCAADNETIYFCAIDASPPFTSLPNPDLVWHKTSDVLPVEGKYVLLYDEKLKDYGYFIGYLYYDPHKIFKDVDGEEIGDQITHWTPLPEFKEDQ